jgi:hypothetical protein
MIAELDFIATKELHIRVPPVRKLNISIQQFADVNMEVVKFFKFVPERCIKEFISYLKNFQINSVVFRTDDSRFF